MNHLTDLRNKALERLWELGSDILGGAIGHFIVDKIENGNVVVGPHGKAVKELNMDKVRAEAPHFAKTVTDDEKFHSLLIDLDPGLQKQMERWLSGLGLHQRAHVAIRLVAMVMDPTEGRTKALKALEQLASIPLDADKTRRAVAFKLMKENETDYLGAQLSIQASVTIEALIEDLGELRVWMDADAQVAQASADQIFDELRQRRNEPLWRKIGRGLALPLRF